jgi:hypothetical protein
LTSYVKARRLYGAKLVMAKIDRLSRDALFLLGLEKAGVDFVAADMSVIGTKQTSQRWFAMSAFGGKADIDGR